MPLFAFGAFSQQLQGLVQVLLGSVETPWPPNRASVGTFSTTVPPRSWFPAPPPSAHMCCTPSLSATDSLPIALSRPHSLHTPHRSPFSSSSLYALCKDPFLPFRIFLEANCSLCSRVFFRSLLLRRSRSLSPSGVHFLTFSLTSASSFCYPVFPPRWTSSCNKGLLLQSSTMTSRHEGNLEIAANNLVCLHPVLRVFFVFQRTHHELRVQLAGRKHAILSNANMVTAKKLTEHMQSPHTTNQDMEQP